MWLILRIALVFRSLLRNAEHYRVSISSPLASPSATRSVNGYRDGTLAARKSGLMYILEPPLKPKSLSYLISHLCA